MSVGHRWVWAVVLASVLILEIVSFSITINPVLAQSPYNFYIWSTSPQLKFGSYAKIEGRLCPTPSTAGAEIITYYYIIKPDGSLITEFAKNKYYCSKTVTVQYFKPDMVGTWSVAAVTQWTYGDSKQQVQSNIVKFVVNSNIK